MGVRAVEPILSIAIQRFGALIACDSNGDRITHVSDNIADVIGQAPECLLGAPLVSVMPHGFTHELRNVMSLRQFAEGRHLAGRHDLPMGARDVSISQSTATGHVVIEFEAVAVSQHSADDFSAEFRHLSSGLRAADDEEKLLRTTTSMMRFATGYDSALIYRFGPSGGQVIAEAGSIARRRFQGKRLTYLENSAETRSGLPHPILHFTVDTDQDLAAILSCDGAPVGLDLSHCHLRGTPPADVDSLAEMGAKAFMTIPIVMNAGLWGMALLLSQHPTTPSRYLRQLCDALILVVSDRLEILTHSTKAWPATVVPKIAMKADFSGKSAVVVGYNRLIAADLKSLLLELGLASVDIFTEEASAREYLADNQVDFAVLDVNLGELSTSFEVARKLVEDGTPFLFASGCGATFDLPDWLGSRLVLLKPTSNREMASRIDELLDVGLE